MAKFITLTEMVRQARHNLDRNVWDYLVGSAETESSQKRNRYGLDAWVFRPRILNDVSTVVARTPVLGMAARLPVIMPPLGSCQLFEPGGATTVARACQDFGVMQIVSSACLPDFEAVARDVPGPKIYQLYLLGDQAWMDDIIHRAIAAGYTGFCLTADTQVYSRRERDLLKRWGPPSGRQTTHTTGFGTQAAMSWDTVAHVKETFDIPLILKGVSVAEDARRCVEAGVDVVYVSNHGGRQLDHTRACIDALVEVVAAVEGRVPVWVDGGFQRGADVVKALCLGASAVGMGRFEGLALAAGGAPALVRALEILEHEITTAMALAGIARLEDLGPSLVERAGAMGQADVLGGFPLLDQGY
ncbi:MAG: alpha-hydroxy-acid oxidizing protein [Pseudomonadales bacterium]|nr:alpha-hydroxy-acid oxidizing protein [Pseudomonadales bacterium]MCP5184600.1 alpha-hydroxy-acid oxidizing protein [Pseudomonadales bacterium]